jgi:tetratricopeptide (TPR) repeat protein
VSETPKTHYDFYKVAKSREKQGLYDEALAAYGQAIELSSDYAHAWYYKGLLHRKLEQYDVAIDCAERALELEPSWERHISKLIEECKSCQ